MPAMTKSKLACALEKTAISEDSKFLLEKGPWKLAPAPAEIWKAPGRNMASRRRSRTRD